MNSGNTDRTQFFALVTLLEALCAPAAMREMENLCSASPDDKHKHSGLVLGYKMVVKAALYRQIELIIARPEILGMRQVDVGLCHWWIYSETKYANRFSQVMSDDAPESALVGNYLNNLLLEVNRSGYKFERFRQVADSVHLFTQTSLSMVDNCRLSPKEEGNSGMVQDVSQALVLLAAEFLHDFIYHNFTYRHGDHTLDDADIYANPNIQSWEDGDVLEDIGLANKIETSRDPVGRRPKYRRSSNNYVLLGINAAAAISLHGLGIQSEMLLRECEGLIPDDELYGELLEEFQTGKYPSQKYELVLNTDLPMKTLESIMSSSSSSIDPLEQLTDFLGNRSFLVSSLRSYGHSTFHFQALLKGLLLSTPRGQQVEVLRIDHSASADESHPPISLAVEVNGEWQVFYRIDAIGRMKSPVWPILENLGGRINLTRIVGVDSNDLLRLCDRAFRYVASQLKAQKDVNSDLRGAIPEILAGLLLANKGYRPVKVSHRLKLNSKEIEIDSIGFREADGREECLLVEVKKSSTTQIQLISELEKFTRKIGLVRENIDAVTQALGHSGSIRRISGLFITMANVGKLVSEGTEEAKVELHGHFFGRLTSGRETAEAEFKASVDSHPDISFWDYSQFNCELKSAGLPELPIRLLERTDMSWELPDFDISELPDYFGMLARAVGNNDWQHPSGTKAIQHKLNEMLRGV